MTNNKLGIAGMAQVRLMAVKVMNDSGEGTDATVAAGLVWAVDHGANIITMSLGVDGVSTVLQNAVLYGAQHGVVMVAASGNKGTSQLSYPAAYPQVIAVGAIDESNQRASFSNYGVGLELVAPGVQIYSTQGSTGYQYLSGTSTATPFVVGTAALMLSVNPALTPGSIRRVLNSTATDVSIPGYDLYTGWGTVNAFKAVQQVSQPAVTITSHPAYAVPNGTLSITWLVTGGEPGVINLTYLEWGDVNGSFTQRSQGFRGTTWATFTDSNISSLRSSGVIYLRGVATIDGTRYNSTVLEIPVHAAPWSNLLTEFMDKARNFIVNDLGVFNFVLLLAALIAIPLIVVGVRSSGRRARVQSERSFQPPPPGWAPAQTMSRPPPPPPPPRFESHVNLTGYEVAPSELRVKEGTKVVWINRAWSPPPGIAIRSGRLDDAGEHPDGLFESGMLIAPGDYWSATFHRAGTYGYYLTGVWRNGKIVVEPYG